MAQELDRDELTLRVCHALSVDHKKAQQIVDNFETFFIKRLVDKLNGLSLRDFIKTKNPYLYRASGIKTCGELVNRAFRDYVSASVETYFGPFFEAVARAMSGGVKPTGGGEIDLDLRYNGHADLIVIKSGPKGFNKSSRHRAYQELASAAGKLGQDDFVVHKLVGYAYGRKRTRTLGDVTHLSSKDFWLRVTGDESFYHKLLDACAFMAPLYNADLEAPRRRLLEQAQALFCEGDRIDWRKLLTVVSG